MLKSDRPRAPDFTNNVDYYQYWRKEAIIADLDTKRFKYAMLICNTVNDINIASVIRTGNALMTNMVYMYGRKKWDKRGAVGTYNYMHFTHLPTEQDLDTIDGYTWIGLDNIDKAVDINEFDWPEKSLICVGSEYTGLAPEVASRCKDVVYIKQYGSVRSLNLGVAAALAMNSWCKQWANKTGDNK